MSFSTEEQAGGSSAATGERGSKAKQLILNFKLSPFQAKLATEYRQVEHKLRVTNANLLHGLKGLFAKSSVIATTASPKVLWVFVRFGWLVYVFVWLCVFGLCIYLVGLCISLRCSSVVLPVPLLCPERAFKANNCICTAHPPSTVCFSKV